MSGFIGGGGAGSATGGGATLTLSQYVTPVQIMNNGGVANSTLNQLTFLPFFLDNNLSATVVKAGYSIALASSAALSGQGAYTHRAGIYSQHATNKSLWTLMTSGSHTMSGAYSSNISQQFAGIAGWVNNTSASTYSFSTLGTDISTLAGGRRLLEYPLASNYAPGEYLMGQVMSYSSAGTPGAFMLAAPLGPAYNPFRRFGFNTTATGAPNDMRDIGMAHYSVTTGALPNSVNISEFVIATGSPVVNAYSFMNSSS